MKMLEPLKLKHTTLKNRVIMGSMHTGLEEAKDAHKKMAKFYAQRAKGGVGLMVTGGISPNFEGKTQPLASQLSFPWQVKAHKLITDAVHKYDSKICMQILHAGRYAYYPLGVTSSTSKSPISPFKARGLTWLGIKKTKFDFINCAKLAQKAGYDGIEIMGSEGYFLNQFIAPRVNKRTDQYGGSFENRIRLPLEIVRGIRKACSKEFIIIFRLSMLDLVEDGSTWEEVVALAKELEKEGIDIINTGIGWHESRVPTIATMVPRAAFTWITEKMKEHVNIPLCTTNRINNPKDINEILDRGQADLVSMARPFLADPDFINKAQENKIEQINTCIGCNQACLDHVFKRKVASCLVNPMACHETEFIKSENFVSKNLAVIGSGPAGLSFAIEAARLGHKVTVFEKNDFIGGQFNIAKEIPGKEEFFETLRYFKNQIKELNVELKLGTEVTSSMLKESKFDEFIFSSGVKPNKPKIEGIDHEKVLSYPEVILEKKPVGKSVAIIGAGGIGFDMAEFLAHNPEHTSESLNKEEFFKHWGVDTSYENRGSIKEKSNPTSFREIYLLQRKETKHGKNLGKTTGWIHRQSLKDYGVNMIGSVQYQKIDDQGLHILVNDEVKVLNVDNVVLCAGQYSDRSLYDEFKTIDKRAAHLIGGAFKSEEIDAKRAINQGVRLAYSI